MDDDEMLDLVDANDKVIGTISRSEYYKLGPEKPGNLRAVEMFIQNDEGKLWVPKRTAHKKIAPNGLDYSMGGHVSAGEDYMTSALRETAEELNLQLSPDDLEFVAKFGPGELPYFRVLYIYKNNDAPAYNPDDFASAMWLFPEEILEQIKNGVPAKQSLYETVKSLVDKS